ncbi:MAG: T9SS type A sorting domain-containing protein, partial [Bacteroidota bacterium]
TLNNAKTKSVVWYNQQGWPVGLSEALSNATTNVYPNPVTDKLYFETTYEKAKNITVVDLAGKVVANINTAEMNTELDVSTFAKGLYFYEIKTEEGATIKSGKFNVQ